MTCPGTGLSVLLILVGHQIPPAASGLLKNPAETTSFNFITASSPHCSFLLGGYTEISTFCLSLQRFEMFAIPSLFVMDLVGAELRGGPVQKYSTSSMHTNRKQYITLIDRIRLSSLYRATHSAGGPHLDINLHLRLGGPHLDIILHLQLGCPTSRHLSRCGFAGCPT
jgi:hypothetical protein